jgi:hypothetical protein
VVEDSLDGLEIHLLSFWGHVEEDLFLDVGEEEGCVGHVDGTPDRGRSGRGGHLKLPFSSPFLLINSYERRYMTMMDENIPYNQCGKICRDPLATAKALDRLTQAPLYVQEHSNLVLHSGNQC